MFYILVLIAATSAVFFYHVGDSDYNGKGLLLTLTSIAVTFFAVGILEWRWLGLLLAQGILFAALTVLNVMGNRRPRD